MRRFQVPVSWRSVLAMGVGLLLPVPLVLLGTLLQPESRSQELTGARISPILGVEQSARLMTYKRVCKFSAECEPPLGCLYASRYKHAYCTDSECTMDTQCPVGQVCRTHATEGNGLRVRICTPIGARQEGENCTSLPADPKSACAAGLLCAGQDGWCARPCKLEEPKGCPEGFFCADTTPEPACLPTCEQGGCPADEQCVHFEERSSKCAHLYGPPCHQSPCPEGQQCRVFLHPEHPGEAWSWCTDRCGEDFPPCNAGTVCDGWRCVPACDPQGSPVCAEGFRCQQSLPGKPFACQPDW